MTIPNLSEMLMENGGGISSIPCTPQEEKRIVTELTSKSESSLKQGNIYYVISNRWFSSWQRFVGLISEATPSNEFVGYHQEEIFPETSARPGPIDNLDIIANTIDSWGENDDLDIIRTLEEGRDYVLVPKEVWEKLFEWYKGGPALPRKMICQGARDDTYIIEVYPLCLNLIDSRDNSSKMIRLSKKTSIAKLYKRVCAIAGLVKEKVRIWDYFNKEKHSELEVSEKSLQEANLEMGQDILLEVDKGLSPGFSMDSTGNELALVAMEPSRSSMTIAGGPTLPNGPSQGYSLPQEGGLRSASSNMETGYNTKSTAAKSEKGGLAGLQNLGNTCFMNSSIQCLVHTPPLVEYFVQDYANDINRDNPLGMHGDLAVAFGDLLRKLWSSGRAPVAPRLFKGKLARFAPQFSGYNQHDSQELLAFLLDGLHEDLNRVKRKPYIEAKDSDGRPDEEVAEECWKNHKARNDSLIVDVCQGQYKSTLVCPVCGKISITFDPFMYLSLPLPSTITRSMTVTVFYGDGSGLPMPYTVTISKRGIIKDLIESLNSACCLNVKEESLLIAEVYDNRIYQYFENFLESLSNIKDEERIVAYRLPKKRTGLSRLEIVHKYCEKSVSDSLKSGERKLLGCPLVTYLDSRLTGSDINAAVSQLLTPLRKKPYISSMNPNSCKTDGPVYEANGEPADNITGHSGDDVQSMDSDRIEEMTGIGRDLFFHLYLIDDRGKILDSIESDGKELKPGPSYRVMLEWTEKELEVYDSSYLKDLPEVKAGITIKKTRQEALSLFTCLETFLKEEPLGPDDMWYCPGCKEHRQATKKLDLWRLPDILVFHLKRFSYSRYLKNKLDAFVNFPIHNLDLSRYVKSNVSSQESSVYELYAISNHYGGLGGGHYSAYAKLLDENKWYDFDDSHVSPVSEADIKTSAAYVLFYQRVKSETKMDLGEPSSSS